MAANPAQIERAHQNALILERQNHVREEPRRNWQSIVLTGIFGLTAFTGLALYKYEQIKAEEKSKVCVTDLVGCRVRPKMNTNLVFVDENGASYTASNGTVLEIVGAQESAQTDEWNLLVEWQIDPDTALRRFANEEQLAPLN